MAAVTALISSIPTSPRLGFGSHKDQHGEPVRSRVPYAVLCTRRGEGDASGAEVPGLLSDAYLSSALQDVIDLVRPFVGVSGLLLARLETVDIAEHPFSVKKVDLLHLLSSKADLGQYVFEDFHTYLISRTYDRHVSSERRPFLRQSGYLSTAHFCLRNVYCACLAETSDGAPSFSRLPSGAKRGQKMRPESLPGERASG